MYFRPKWLGDGTGCALMVLIGVFAACFIAALIALKIAIDSIGMAHGADRLPGGGTGVAPLVQQATQHLKEDKCVTIEKYLEAFHSLPPEIRNQLHIRTIDGDDAARWRKAFNALPPASDMNFDRVGFVFRDGNDSVAVIMELDGCVISTGMMPMRTFRMLISDSHNERGSVV